MISTRAEQTRRRLELRRAASVPKDLHKPPRTLAAASARQSDDSATRILIADDHDIVRYGLRAFLELDSSLEVVGEAADGAHAVRLAHRLRPDVVLIDLVMPELDGIAATEVIHRELPNTKVVVLTSLLEDESVVRALRAGAVGYLLKDTRGPELRQAIKAAAVGQLQISGIVAAQLVHMVVLPKRPEALSQRETQVLRLLARGSANKQIGRDLGIAEKTVKTHVSSILGKLGVQNRTQAALYAGRVGLVSLNQLGDSGNNGNDRTPSLHGRKPLEQLVNRERY